MKVWRAAFFYAVILFCLTLGAMGYVLFRGYGLWSLQYLPVIAAEIVVLIALWRERRRRIDA